MVLNLKQMWKQALEEVPVDHECDRKAKMKWMGD